MAIQAEYPLGRLSRADLAQVSTASAVKEFLPLDVYSAAPASLRRDAPGVARFRLALRLVT